jgi:hypothetical protein
MTNGTNAKAEVITEFPGYVIQPSARAALTKP